MKVDTKKMCLLFFIVQVLYNLDGGSMVDKVRLAAPLQCDSIVDGEGIRTVIWFQGCLHNCFKCHNPESHDFNGGFLESISRVKEEIDKLEFQNGITFSGGDPMYQPEALYELALYAHEKNLNVWCYTGFTFEKLVEMSSSNGIIHKVLEEIDVLVDGPFINNKKSLNIKFRGSTNQRIIDVKKSLKSSKVVLIEKYIYKEEN